MLGELLLEFLRASRVRFLQDRATFPYLSTVTLFRRSAVPLLRCCAIDRRFASMSFPRDPAPRHLRTRHRKMYTRRLRFLPRGETTSSSSSNPLDVRSISRCNEHTPSTRVFLRLFGFAGLKEFQFIVILWRMQACFFLPVTLYS